MRPARSTYLALAIVSLVAIAACGRKAHSTGHAFEPGETSMAMATAPTPDNTPIEALRTPAGLVLKTGAEPTVTPSPGGGAATPSPARAAS